MAELSTEPVTKHNESGDQHMSYMSSKCPLSNFTKLQFSLFLEGDDESLVPFTRLPSTLREELGSSLSLQMWTTVSENGQGVVHWYVHKNQLHTISSRGKEFTYTIE